MRSIESLQAQVKLYRVRGTEPEQWKQYILNSAGNPMVFYYGSAQALIDAMLTVDVVLFMEEVKK